jgi:hypothetical protein
VHIRRKLAALVTAAGLLCTLTLTAGIAMAANPSADLDQCANGSVASPDSSPCQSSNEWVNGNLGASKAHYNEGDSVAYRMRFGNLPNGSHSVTIAWDTTKSSKHALDYLTTFNRTVGAAADPMVGVTGYSAADRDLVSGFSAFAIPADPQVTGAGVTPIPGEFRLWGGTITSVGATPFYSYPGGTGFTGDKSASITITFDVTKPNPVLAWGGHIATRVNWGSGNSAVAISGSPFHMRLLNLDGSGGNQDRSLSNDAVTFPASIKIIKDAVPDSSDDFLFSASGGLSPTSFVLDDDSDPTLSNQQLYSNLTNFTATYTITEAPAATWTLTGRECSAGSSANSGASDFVTSGVTISPKEGEEWVCTFTNTPTPAPKLSITKVATESGFSAKDEVIHYTIVATNSGNVTLSAVTVTDSQVSDLACTPTNGSSLAPGASMTCTASHTITQADLDAGSFYNQACVDDGAGGAASKCADVTTPGTKNAVLTLTKTDDLNPDLYDVGDVVTYTITATNDGNVTLHNVTVSDAPTLDGFDCTPDLPVASLAPGDSVVCTGTHTMTQEDLSAGSFKDTASATSTEDSAPDAEDTVFGKNIGSFETTPTLRPRDVINLNDLTANAGGTLFVELRIDEECRPTGDDSPAWAKTFAVDGSGPYYAVSDVEVSQDSEIRWCVSYSGDANNAAIPWGDHHEVVTVTFDPLLGSAFGGAAIPMLAWALWSRRRRSQEEK